MPQISPNTVYESTSATSPLTADEADHLYFECRDSNYIHTQAVLYVQGNGAPSSWEPPHPSDYEGLPDVKTAASLGNIIPLLNRNDHSLKPQTEEQKKHLSNLAREQFNLLIEQSSFKPSFENLDYVSYGIVKRPNRLTLHCYRAQIRPKSKGKDTEKVGFDKRFFFNPGDQVSEKNAFENAVRSVNEMLASKAPALSTAHAQQ